MKNLRLTSVLMLAVLMVTSIASCSKSAKLEKAAKEQMEVTLREVARDPSSVNLSNVETVYCDDSLCIIHCDFSAKNGFGNDVTDKCEYIFIRSNGKNYESYSTIDNKEDGVFVTKEQYEKNKKGTIYKTLPYESGLRYLAAIQVNTEGREAGVKDGGEFNIPVPTGTGMWELKSYKDEFGDEDSERYLLLVGNGVFSNSATTNSKMTAILYVDNSNFSFKLIEYNSSVVKSDDFYQYRIKDSEGEVHELILMNNNKSGQMSTLFGVGNTIMEKILLKEGTITVSVKEQNAYSTPDTYLFKLNLDGYAKAKTFLNND